MSRALQIKQTEELLGTKLLITDDDIIQTLTDIINSLHVQGEESLMFGSRSNFVIQFSVRVILNDNIETNEHFVYMHYDKIKNDLSYTTYLTERIRREGFKMTRQKFHRLLMEVMNKRLKLRIGRVYPHMKYARFPVC